MIDWSTEIEKAKIRKAELEANKRLELEEKKRQEQLTKEKVYADNIIFDSVIAEEIEAIRNLLSSYIYLTIKVSNGNIHFETRIPHSNGITTGSSVDFYMVTNNEEDLATYTSIRLTKFVTWLILYWL